MDFKKLLQSRKDELEKSLVSIQDSSKPVDLNDPIGRLSRMDAIQQQQMSLNAKKQIELNLQLVDTAIKRLEQGNFGYCLKCDEEINIKRLLAKPEASFCTKCQI
jgi:DnaK suppressor protein